MYHKAQLIKALKAQIEAQNKIIELQKQLNTRLGFFNYYFDNLPNFKTQIDCFNMVNELHHQVFNEYKYSDYNSFRHQVPTLLKIKK